MTDQRDSFLVSAVDWQTIVDALHEGVTVLDTRGRILACNHAAAAMIGRSRSELIGITPLDLDLGAVDEDGVALTPEEHPSAIARRTATPCASR
jgi:PAS domain S-box-containing protein